ncbi:MAG: DUF3833 family protein [Rhodospirillales bacterium]|nr:DUF3833 family protein [Rhodospirillales bacterium]
MTGQYRTTGQHRTKTLIVAAAVLAVGTAFLAGCARTQIDDFSERSPKLVLERFFEGRTEGWGIVQSRFGTLERQFRVKADGVWDDAAQTLRLTETWTFDDGQVDRLQWNIRRLGSGQYVGSEARLVGEAKGEQAGNAFRWRYTRRVPMPDGDERQLDFDDWFWLQDETVLISRASIGRFGMEFATISLFYQKP